MDSFIKESTRTTPVESSKSGFCYHSVLYAGRVNRSIRPLVSSRRLALTPFELSNGAKVEPGEWVCTPLRAMNRDPAKYSKPDDFHGFRFVDPNLLERIESPSSGFQIPEPGQPSDLTEVTADWQLWGIGRIAWYVATSRANVIAAISMTEKLIPI